MPDLIRVQDNERIDRGDFEHVADVTPQAVGRALPANMLTHPSGTRTWVVGGFDMTNPAAAQLRIDRGVALLSQREKGQIVSGVLTFEGDSQKIVDLAAYANGVYGAYVRAELPSGEFQNRIFWNPATPPGSEAPQSIATRRVANWGVLVVAAAPTGEWFKIGEVTVTAGLITLITKQREFYFEGDEAAAYAAKVSDTASTYRAWGTGNDRNADRALYGVRDFQTFTAAVRSQMASLLGQAWYATPTEALNQKVSRNGDAAMVGAYSITGTLAVSSTLLVSGTTTLSAAVVNGLLTANASISLPATSHVVPSAAGPRLGDTPAANRFLALYAERWDVLAATPVCDIEMTSIATIGKLHWFMQGQEATRFFDLGYQPSTGHASYNAGPVAGAAHVFSVNGTTLMSVGDATAGYFGVAVDATFTQAVDVLGDLDTAGLLVTDVKSDLIPEGVSGARKLGTALKRWDAYLDAVDAASLVVSGATTLSGTVTGNILPTASGQAIGSSTAAADRWEHGYFGVVHAATSLIVGTGTTLTVAVSGTQLTTGRFAAIGAGVVDASLEAANDYVGAADGGDASSGTVANTSDVGVIARFKSTDARVQAGAITTLDYPLTIRTGALANAQRGAIKVELSDGAGNTVRGFIRVWATPQGT